METQIDALMDFEADGEEERPPVIYRRSFVLDEQGAVVIPDVYLRSQDALGTVIQSRWKDVGVDVLAVEVLLTDFGKAFRFGYIPRRVSLSQVLELVELLSWFLIDYVTTSSIDCAMVYSKTRLARGGKK